MGKTKTKTGGIYNIFNNKAKIKKKRNKNKGNNAPNQMFKFDLHGN